MKKYLRILFGIKEVNPEVETSKKEIEKALLDAYKSKKLEYAKILGEEKAKFEYEQAKKRFEIKQKGTNWFMDWLTKEDKK